MSKAATFMLFVSVLILCAAATAMQGAKAQTVTPQPVAAQPIVPDTQAPPTFLSMPLVGVDEGQRFQQARSVQISSVPALPRVAVSEAAAAPSFAGVSGDVLNEPSAKPTLGHPLPTTTMTPLGYPRADFAIGRGKSAVTKTAVTASGASPSPGSALSNTVVQ